MLLWKNKQVLQWRNGQRTWTEYPQRINILKYIFSDGKSEENCNSFQSWWECKFAQLFMKNVLFQVEGP